MKKYFLKPKIYNRDSMVLVLISSFVFLTGAITVISVLFAQTRLSAERVVAAEAHLTLLVGLTFIYLATLLRRGKHTAWLIAYPLYAYIVLHNIRRLFLGLPADIDNPLLLTLNLIIPVLTLAGLVVFRDHFRVRSQISNFGPAFARAILVLLVAFFYGVLGFQLLDEHDFHQELAPLTGAHYTIDQLNITTKAPLQPYTKRATLFLDSLATISVGALFYVAVSLFSPIRFRLSDQRHNRQELQKLLEQYPSNSEDFFKLWPHDKAYFFSKNRRSCLAYKVKAGMAMVVGDPAGEANGFAQLINDFSDYCYINDWSPAFVHVQEKYIPLYDKLDFTVQKLGEEAVVEIKHFQDNVASNKYFRNINNRFGRKNYTCKIFTPPHSRALLKKLRKISNEWLKAPARTERTMMMGFFEEHYLQNCAVMIAADEEGQIQAFINQVPTFDKDEANFDFLRSSLDAPSNINDYLILNFIKHLQEEGYQRLNMGLAPLVGIKRPKASDADVTTIDNALQLIYTAGGRFYSFAGLKRFKDKYEPQWQPRYVAYRGGIVGFSKLINALVRAMKV